MSLRRLFLLGIISCFTMTSCGSDKKSVSTSPSRSVPQVAPGGVESKTQGADQNVIQKILSHGDVENTSGPKSGMRAYDPCADKHCGPKKEAPETDEGMRKSSYPSKK